MGDSIPTRRQFCITDRDETIMLHLYLSSKEITPGVDICSLPAAMRSVQESVFSCEISRHSSAAVCCQGDQQMTTSSAARIVR